MTASCKVSRSRASWKNLRLVLDFRDPKREITESKVEGKNSAAIGGLKEETSFNAARMFEAALAPDVLMTRGN